MRQIRNKQLTKHFWLYEFLEAELPSEAIAMNWDVINSDTVYKAELMALEIEKIRKLVNDNYKSDIGFQEIGLRITSGFRCREWELKRGRSGNSQHTIMAADFQAINCSREMGANILSWIFEKYDPWWCGGLAKKDPSKEGKRFFLGFIHIDQRDIKARWIYT